MLWRFEVGLSIQSVNYIYNYHDAATVIKQNDSGESIIVHDEIKNFMETRYVSSIEAS